MERVSGDKFVVHRQGSAQAQAQAAHGALDAFMLRPGTVSETDSDAGDINSVPDAKWKRLHPHRPQWGESTGLTLIGCWPTRSAMVARNWSWSTRSPALGSVPPMPCPWARSLTALGSVSVQVLGGPS